MPSCGILRFIVSLALNPGRLRRRQRFTRLWRAGKPLDLHLFNYQTGIHPAKGKVLDGCDADL
jgi:hypothetical protein